MMRTIKYAIARRCEGMRGVVFMTRTAFFYAHFCGCA